MIDIEKAKEFVIQNNIYKKIYIKTRIRKAVFLY